MIHFNDAINRLEQLTKDAPEVQYEENKSLASEIIADQQEQGEIKMDYREELIQLIQQINDSELIERIYVFARRFIKNWEG